MAYQGKDIYKQLEILIIQNEKLLNDVSKYKNVDNELKKLNTKINELLIENKNQTETIKILEKMIDERDAVIDKLKNDNDRFKNQATKNSTNSSKPSSSNNQTPKKKTGANLYNYRRKTEKKVGGQIGHKGANLSKKQVEDLIKDNKVKVREVIHYINGSAKEDDIVKYAFNIEVVTIVEKHIFKHRKKSKETLPKEFYTDVTYGINIKALAIHLGAYNVISYDRLSEFFSVISNNVLNISNGTLVNFLYDFSNKSKDSINNLQNDLLNSDIIYTDETGTKFNKKKVHVRNYSNEKTVLYKGHLNKGHKPILEDAILTNYTGGIMGDHDTTLYSYGMENYECNPHVGRALEEIIQNVYNVNWMKDMKDFLFRLNNTRNLAIEFGLISFDNHEINKYYDEYDKIVEQGKKELEYISSTFYRNKANALIKRFIKYKDNHLFFIKKFSVAFDNNLSERDLRMFKTKTKISGGFRSLDAFKHYTNSLSIIKTSKKRDINPFDSIKKIFNNEILFS